MADFTVTTHAATRWAQRTQGIKKPSSQQINAAADEVLAAVLTARAVYRFKTTKKRIFVTPEGVHMVVAPGGVVVSVMDRAWIVYRCPCGGCVRKRASMINSGINDVHLLKGANTAVDRRRRRRKRRDTNR